MQEPLLKDAPSAPDRCRDPILRPGGTNCGGCGMSLGFSFLDRAVAEHQIQIVIPACCGIVTPGHYPTSAYGAPVIASTFASSAAALFAHRSSSRDVMCSGRMSPPPSPSM